MRKRRLIIILSLLLLTGLTIAFIWPNRPPRCNQTVDVFEGITYHRQARSSPRPLMIHIITIDTSAPGLEFLVTPGETNQPREYRARTTTEFLQDYQVQVAINGGFFRPFHSRNPLDYYPHSGDLVDVAGLAIANGERYSTDKPDFPSVCITATDVVIRHWGCAAGTEQAVTGNRLLINRGQIQTKFVKPTTKNLHPRTAVGVDKSGQTVWLVVVDGRQGGYSEGLTLHELAELLVELGAEEAVNLDGGGSSTLVVEQEGQAETLNAPYHTRIRMRERPVANHLGVYARPRK